MIFMNDDLFYELIGLIALEQFGQLLTKVICSEGIQREKK